MNAKDIGERLLKLRGDRSREEVAKAVGVSTSAMSMYENGERIPRDGIKINLANYYEKSVQEIFLMKNVTLSDWMRNNKRIARNNKTCRKMY